MHGDSIRAWVEEVEYGEPSCTQPPFDKSGNPLPGSLTTTLRDEDGRVPPKALLRDGSVKELPRSRRTTPTCYGTEAADLHLQINRKAIPARNSSKKILHQDDLTSKQLHAAKPQNGNKTWREDRRETEVSEPNLDFEAGDLDLTLAMPGYYDNLRRLDSMYAMSEITKEEAKAARQGAIDSRKEARFSYMDPEKLAVTKPTDTHSGTSPPKKSRFVENFHLDVTEPRPEKPFARRPRTKSDLFRSNAIRRFANTYVEHRTKSLRLELTEPLELPNARRPSTCSNIIRSNAIRRPSNTYVEHNADALKVAVVKVPPAKTNNRPSGNFF